MTNIMLSPAQLQDFETDGFIILRSLFDAEEVELLHKIAKADQALVEESRNRLDSEGNVTRLALRERLGDDMYSAIASCPRVVVPIEQIFGGSACHYHHKMNMKEAMVGGAWEWHQDYGYWYNNGFLYPRMISCFIAVDRSTRENGCLQVIRGSHAMGRIDHGKIGDQTGADVERTHEALKHLELVYVEMEPGDALYFHGNLLHRSDVNRSDKPRWTFICCYTAADNLPYKDLGHPGLTEIEKRPDAAVKETGRRQWNAMQSRIESHSV